MQVHLRVLGKEGHCVTLIFQNLQWQLFRDKAVMSRNVFAWQFPSPKATIVDVQRKGCYVTKCLRVTVFKTILTVLYLKNHTNGYSKGRRSTPSRNDLFCFGPANPKSWKQYFLYKSRSRHSFPAYFKFTKRKRAWFRSPVQCRRIECVIQQWFGSPEQFNFFQSTHLFNRIPGVKPQECVFTLKHKIRTSAHIHSIKS